VTPFKCFDSMEELQGAVNRFVDNNLIDFNELNEMYGLPIGTWCVLHVTNFSHLFSTAQNPAVWAFNEPLSNWNTSNATNMSYMFYYNSSEPLSSNMFNQAVSHFNMSKVTTMASMFEGATAFNHELLGWQTTSLKNMSKMFSGSRFDQKISHLDVSKVETMHALFQFVGYNQDLMNWNTSSVTNMSNMFLGNGYFNQAVSHWDVSNVKNLGSMFMWAYGFNQSLCAWTSLIGQDTNVSDMSNGTSCPLQADPIMGPSGFNPLCHTC